jgi:hypothetical protein
MSEVAARWNAPTNWCDGFQMLLQRRSPQKPCVRRRPTKLCRLCGYRFNTIVWSVDGYRFYNCDKRRVFVVLLQWHTLVCRTSLPVFISSLYVVSDGPNACKEDTQLAARQSGAGADFLRVLRFPLPIFVPPIAPQSPPSSLIWGWYNRPVVAAVPSGLSRTTRGICWASYFI